MFSNKQTVKTNYLCYAKSLWNLGRGVIRCRMLKHTVNKVSSLRDFLIVAACRMLKHTVNKVSSLRDFLIITANRMLKHTVNKVSSLRDF
jgi:hypothetical protein